MRRSEQEVTDRTEIEAILQEATVCHLGLIDGGEPYVVPLSFGYRDGGLYLHMAPEGKKMTALWLGGRVCFEMEVDGGLVASGPPCSWGIRYRSVIGWGKAAFLEDLAEKARALNIIIEHYGGAAVEYTEASLKKVAVARIKIEEMTGKRAG